MRGLAGVVAAACARRDQTMRFRSSRGADAHGTDPQKLVAHMQPVGLDHQQIALTSRSRCERSEAAHSAIRSCLVAYTLGKTKVRMKDVAQRGPVLPTRAMRSGWRISPPAAFCP
ncbi:MAG: hypothetical protein CR964_00665 [Rhodobacterales bacterium]|nr:MAG: hypothetical protein CR964_00665 [Rhodobacterales bacterium]